MLRGEKKHFYNLLFQNSKTAIVEVKTAHYCLHLR